MIEIIILGDPKAQKRHRTFRRGKFAGRYDPSEKEKADFLMAIQSNAPEKPLEGPLFLMLTFYMKRPSGHYGTGRNAGNLKISAPLMHTKKPDVDNLIKFVLDAMSGIFWRDDSIISSLNAQKKYDDRPRTIIQIHMPIDEELSQLAF